MIYIIYACKRGNLAWLIFLSITFTSINKNKLKSLIIIRKSNSRFHIYIHLYIIHMDCLLLVMNLSSLIYYQSLSLNATPASFSRGNGELPVKPLWRNVFSPPVSRNSTGQVAGETRDRPENVDSPFPHNPWPALPVHSHAAFSATARITHWGTGLFPPCLTFWPH